MTITLLREFLLAVGATLGFAVLFNAPPRVLVFCSVNGGLAFLVRQILRTAGLSLELATLVAAVSIGLLGELGARRHQVPALIFKVTGFIPLVPGALSYRTVQVVIEGDYTEGLATGLRTGMLGLAIAGGIGAVTALARLKRAQRKAS